MREDQDPDAPGYWESKVDKQLLAQRVEALEIVCCGRIKAHRRTNRVVLQYWYQAVHQLAAGSRVGTCRLESVEEPAGKVESVDEPAAKEVPSTQLRASATEFLPKQQPSQDQHRYRPKAERHGKLCAARRAEKRMLDPAVQQKAELYKPNSIAALQQAESPADAVAAFRVLHDFFATTRMLYDSAMRQQNGAPKNAYHGYTYSRSKGLAD